MRDNPLVSPSEVNRHHYTLAFLGSGSERFAGSGSEDIWPTGIIGD